MNEHMTQSGLMTHKELFVEYFLEKWSLSESHGGEQPQDEEDTKQSKAEKCKDTGSLLTVLNYWKKSHIYPTLFKKYATQ